MAKAKKPFKASRSRRPSNDAKNFTSAKLPPTGLEQPKLPEWITLPGALKMPDWRTAPAFESDELERARAVLDRAARPRPVVIIAPAAKDDQEPAASAVSVSAAGWLARTFKTYPRPPEMKPAAYCREVLKRMRVAVAAGAADKVLAFKTILNRYCEWAKGDRKAVKKRQYKTQRKAQHGNKF